MTELSSAVSPSDAISLGRVCLLADARSPLVHRWLEHTAAVGYDVHLISIDALVTPIRGVTSHCAGSKLANSRSRMIRYGLSLFSIAKTLRRIRPDIVHAHYAWGYGILGALVAPRPLIVSLWGSDLLASAPRSRVHAAIMRFVLRRADVVCATSAYLKEAARQYTNKTVVQTPFGVDCQLFAPSPKSSTSSFVTIGMVKRLDSNSGAEVLLRAIAELYMSGERNVRLRFTGRIAEASLPSLADSLGIGAITTFDGNVDSSAVPVILREIDIFAQPSVRTEGFGVAVLEAGASGVPVVASNLGGLTEVVLDGMTGYLVEPGNVSALAASIGTLVGNEKLRLQMGIAARKFVVREYAWETTASIMDSLYVDILDRKRK